MEIDGFFHLSLQPFAFGVICLPSCPSLPPFHPLLQFASYCKLQQEQRGTCWTKNWFLLHPNHLFFIYNALCLIKKEPFPLVVPLPFLHSCWNAVCSLPRWPSEPRVRPEQGLCDLQLCLLSTQTSVRTAGRTREGQTVESKSAHRGAAHAHPKTHTHAKCALEYMSEKHAQTNICWQN